MQPSIGRLVSILYRKSQVFLNNQLKNFNLTTPEMSILLFLYKKEGVTQEELASYLMIDKAAMARTIPVMIEKGYLRREKDLEDKRANRIFLTNKAEEIKETVIGALKQWNYFLTQDIRKEDVEVMYRVLEEMVEKVEKADL